MFVIASSPGCNGGTGDCAACGLAGCDADQSGDSGVLTQPTKTAALQPTVNMVAIGRLIGVYLLRSVRPFDSKPDDEYAVACCENDATIAISCALRDFSEPYRTSSDWLRLPPDFRHRPTCPGPRQSE